jgi:hypothetical protein
VAVRLVVQLLTAIDEQPEALVVVEGVECIGLDRIEKTGRMRVVERLVVSNSVSP